MRRFRLLPLLALGLAMMLGGCVLYPDGYGRGYGHERGYYYGGGWGYHHHHDRDRW